VYLGQNEVPGAAQIDTSGAIVSNPNVPATVDTITVVAQRPSVWPWIIGLVALGLLIYAITSQKTR
jgi:hypothetical protein